MKKMNRNLRFKIENAGVKFLLGVVHLFPLRVLRPFGACLGWIAFSVCGIRRSVAIDNIRSALSCDAKQARRIACRAYMNLGRSLVEFASFKKLSRAQIQEIVAFEGSEHFEEVLQLGRGAVLFTGHFGNWELLAARVAATGSPFNVLVGEQSNHRVDELINSLRHSQNISVIYQKAGLRHVLQALAKKEFVAILADQDARRRGIFVDFLGRPASTFREPARLAIARGCPIITGFIVRRKDGRHMAKIQPPLWPTPGLEKEDAIRDLTQRYTTVLESFVREYPDHYFWAHRRWKTKPPNSQ
jgi:KDO2-lipid IV(A) lauroyltransferase